MDISFDIASFLFLFCISIRGGLRSDEPSLVSRNSWYLSFLHFKTIISSLQKKGIRVKIVPYKSFSRLFYWLCFVSRHFHHLRLDFKHELFGLEYHVTIVRDLFGRIDSPLFVLAEMLDSGDYVKVLF